MKARAHVVLLVLLVVSLSLNLLVWPGLAREPDVGPLIRDAIQRESPLLQTYTFAGDLLAYVPGIGAAGDAIATWGYRDSFERIRTQPAVALEVIDGSGHGAIQRLLRINAVATPVLLAAWGLAFWLRPRQVSTIKRRR